MPFDLKEQRYIESTARLSKFSGISAGVISLLTVATTWGHWRLVATVVVIQVFLLAFNTWASLVMIRRWGVKATEVTRTLVNCAGFIVVAQLTQFSLAVWLWLPHVALNFDHFSRRAALTILLVLSTVADVLSFVNGVQWPYPVIFTTLAFICLGFSRARFDVIREMLCESDDQRRELALAHADVKQAHERLTHETRVREEMELELRQSQKLEAIGRLASGIAHEINTPVQFVGDGVHFLGEASGELLGLLAKYRQMEFVVRSGGSPAEAAAVLAEAEDAINLPYLQETLPAATARTLDGLARIATIVRSMKEFAHPDQKEPTLLDVNRALEVTVAIARNEYCMVAEVELDLGEVPMVMCHPGEANQVFLNLIVNAAHAIGDVVGGSRARGRITISTRLDGDAVVVSVIDTGTGIPLAVRDRVFDPFFTTKDVGKGTGQGLAIARRIVIGHGGTLSFDSTLGSGTRFTVRWPIRATQRRAIAA